MTFGNWWGNWLYYWKLSGADVAVTLRHPYGTATATIDVIGADIRYQLLNVYLPLLVELAIALFLITWVWLVVTKPRFPKGARLYCGQVIYRNGQQYLTSFKQINLTKQNGFFKNGRWKFKRSADVVTVGGVKIRPDRGEILCEEEQPWYRCSVLLEDGMAGPSTLQNKFELSKGQSLPIEQLLITMKLGKDSGRKLSSDDTGIGIVIKAKTNSDGDVIEGTLLYYRIAKN